MAKIEMEADEMVYSQQKKTFYFVKTTLFRISSMFQYDLFQSLNKVVTTTVCLCQLVLAEFCLVSDHKHSLIHTHFIGWSVL